MKKGYDAIIVGSGIVGNAAAYYLQKKGYDTLVLEASENIGDGGSSRNGGGVRQSGRDVRELPYAMYGIQNIWPGLSDELGADVEYHQGGNLRLAIEESHLPILERLASNAQALGLGVEMVDAAQVREICPHLSERVVGASWCPTDGHANPLRATLAFYRKARQLGADFITGEPAVGLKTAKGRISAVIGASGAEYEGDHVILAAGYSSRAIAASVGIWFPMSLFYEECIVTEALPPMFDIMLGVATAEMYGHQSEQGSFVFGSGTGLEATYEYEGGSVLSKPLDAAANCRVVLKYVPALADAKIVRTWGGWMDMTPDHVPILGEVSEIPGLIAACGMSGHGFGPGPAVGLMLSQMVAGEELICDISPLRYDRFHSDR